MPEKRKVASLKKERFQRTFQQIVLFSNLLLPTLKNSTSIWSIKNVHISNKFWPFKIKTRTHQGNYNANFTLFTIYCHDLFSLHVFPICFSTMFKLFHNFALTLSHFTSHSFGKLYSLLFYFPRFLFGILITWTSFTDAQRQCHNRVTLGFRKITAKTISENVSTTRSTLLHPPWHRRTDNCRYIKMFDFESANACKCQKQTPDESNESVITV